MKRKIVLIAIGVVAVVAALFWLFNWHIALLIVSGLCFFGVLFAVIMFGLQYWIELEKKDPEKAKQLWHDAICDMELYNQYMPRL